MEMLRFSCRIESLRLSGEPDRPSPTQQSLWCSDSPAWIDLAELNKELFFHQSRHWFNSPARGSVREVQPLLPSGRRLTESVFPYPLHQGSAGLSGEPRSSRSWRTKAVWLCPLLPLTRMSAGLKGELSLHLHSDAVRQLFAALLSTGRCERDGAGVGGALNLYWPICNKEV